MSKSASKIIAELESALPILDGIIKNKKETADVVESKTDLSWIHTEIPQRVKFIENSILRTANGSKAAVEKAVLLFRDWMIDGLIVRILGAGRARLAGTIPANRLAHGGARVYIQDDMVPLPHSIKGGGVIAVSASGKTPSVLEALKSIREKGENITVVGIAKKGAVKFEECCHVFIGIDEDTETDNPLKALADTGEYVISELLDAIVVAAGKLAGFDETTWRLGHEDIGATGPYQAATISAIFSR